MSDKESQYIKERRALDALKLAAHDCAILKFDLAQMLGTVRGQYHLVYSEQSQEEEKTK